MEKENWLVYATNSYTIKHWEDTDAFYGVCRSLHDAGGQVFYKRLVNTDKRYGVPRNAYVLTNQGSYQARDGFAGMVLFTTLYDPGYAFVREFFRHQRPKRIIIVGDNNYCMWGGNVDQDFEPICLRHAAHCRLAWDTSIKKELRTAARRWEAIDTPHRAVTP